MPPSRAGVHRVLSAARQARALAPSRFLGVAGVVAISFGALTACSAFSSAGTHAPATKTIAADRQGGWKITVYVTPVERYYGGSPREITGCLTVNCGYRNDDHDLGSYPVGFVRRVKDEGTGLITSGPQAGHYLDWSAGVSDSGYWLDTVARDSYGGALRPFVAAASDTLPRFTKVRVVGCGTNTDGTAVDRHACAVLRAGKWQILDQFTPGLGGSHHIDLYIGDETQPNFENTSPLWITWTGATLVTSPPAR